MQRRQFLKGVLSLAVIASNLPAIAEAGLPILYGDGMHDDTKAFQAMMDGAPFRTIDGFRGTAIEGRIYQGDFLFTDTIRIRRPNITIEHCRFEFEGPPGIPVLEFLPGSDNGAIVGCSFALPHPGPSLYWRG